jgi:hypothetical protein
MAATENRHRLRARAVRRSATPDAACKAGGEAPAQAATVVVRACIACLPAHPPARIDSRSCTVFDALMGG